MRRTEGLIIQAEEDYDHDHEILLESEAPGLHSQSVVVLNATQIQVRKNITTLDPNSHSCSFRCHEIGYQLYHHIDCTEYTSDHGSFMQVKPGTTACC